jgi:hypothetical protein
MTSEGRAGEAVLALARQLRHAVATRQQTMQDALQAYNHAGGSRLDYAAAFLKTTQRADVAYEQCSRDALHAYRETIDQE